MAGRWRCRCARRARTCERWKCRLTIAAAPAVIQKLRAQCAAQSSPPLASSSPSPASRCKDVELFLCASVSLWLTDLPETNHRDTEAQRKPTKVSSADNDA